MSITDDLWVRFGRLDVRDLPAEVSTIARQAILDWFACAHAGSQEPLARILRDELVAAEGPASVIGSERRTATLAAALVNGATGHALDFDDTHTVMGGHPTAPLLPAALALAEDLDRTGADLLAAFVAGFEVEARLGAGIGPSHYAKGWHVTSTIGVFGAATAAAHLLRLDAEQYGHAIGLAASQSSGLKANFGTMTKPFHAGHAAERGLLSACLARRGFTANPDALDANQGLAQAAGDGSWHPERLDRHGEWLISENLFKYHAACYLTHAAIEATSTLVPAGEDVDAITLAVNPAILDVCGIPVPRTGLEAKFSVRAATAFRALGIDTSDPASFTDANATDPRVRDLVERISVVPDAAVRTTETRVEVRRGTATTQATFDSGVPATDLVEQGRKLRAKFNALVEPSLGADAKALADRIEHIADLPSARLLARG